MSSKSKLLIESPRMPEKIPSLSWEGKIEAEDEFRMGIIQDTQIEHQTAHRVTFEQIIFRNVTFNGNAGLS